MLLGLTDLLETSEDISISNLLIGPKRKEF